MTHRRWMLVALTVASLVWALGGESISIAKELPENHLLDALVGLSFFGAGIVALDRRPGNLIGPLMIAFAFLWYLGNWGNLHSVPVLPALGLLSGYLSSAVVAHIALAYPSGRVRNRFDRIVLIVIYAGVIAGSVAVVVTFDPRAFDCSSCGWQPAIFHNLPLFHAVRRAADGAALLLAPLFLITVWLRWRGASRAERRDLTPLWVAVTMLACDYLLNAFASPDPRDPFAYLLWEIRSLILIAVPLVFLWGLLTKSLSRTAVSDLVLELERPLAPGELKERLARALGDPSLELVYALERGEGWVASDGRSVALPTAGGGTGAPTVTLVERDGRPLAAMIHDPALDEQLVRAAGAAAGMSIANERLQAEVRAQLAEVRASRQRIVETGDRERRRVERNLHDGAQQRLVSLSLALSMLRERDGLAPNVATELDEASAMLKQALVELRELARGIHPAILTEEGLEAAVDSLADRTSVPVDVRSEVDVRLPEPLEATAYFVVSESLANVAKYARASSAAVTLSRRDGVLRIEVSDNGVGGADPRDGSGLRGLEDRVAAVGGRLWVNSPQGEGTAVIAELPIDA